MIHIPRSAKCDDILHSCMESYDVEAQFFIWLFLKILLNAYNYFLLAKLAKTIWLVFLPLAKMAIAFRCLQ